MSRKKTQSTTDKNAARKAAVLGSEKKRTFPLNTILPAAAIIAIVIIFLLVKGGAKDLPTATPVVADTQPTRIAAAENPADASSDAPVVYSTSDGQVTYSTDQFDDGRASYYEYLTDDGINIRYFILKSSDGVLRAAFDACDVCWASGKGYQQSGDNMVCQNCGRQFPSVSVNEIEGGCNPAPLDRRIEGDELIIDVNQILRGTQYFDFGGGR